MRYVHKLFSGRHAGRPAAVLTVALGLAFACSESPTETTLDDLAPRFHHRPGHGGGPGGGDDPAPIVTGNLLPTFTGQTSPAGVYGDGNNEIAQACADGHAVFLVKPAGMPAGLLLPPVCPNPGRSQVHLPGDPLAGNQDPYGDPGPSFDIKGGSGKIHPTGWMRPTLNLFWDCDGSFFDENGVAVDSRYCNFVWTDGVAITEATGGNVTGGTVTGHCALLYVDQTGVPIPPLAAPEGDPPTPMCDPVDQNGNSIVDFFGDDVTGFPLELLVDLTVQ